MSPSRSTLAGRYRLEEVIGRGGMSTVYRARDAVLERTVAVKVLLAGLADHDPAYVARFEREARAAAALHHPAVVGVYDVGVDRDTRFIVMEYVRGRSVQALLRESEPPAVSEALRIGERVADALGTAHARGIVHRDIKPANVMVAEDTSVKVLDFGVARMLDGTTITQAAAVLGTAAYMAPERAMGQPGDARSDIYSLGCLLYAMLAGNPPFDAELAAALLNQHVNSTPRPVASLRPDVPPELDALVGGMLAKSPAERPESASAVAERLAAIAASPTSRAVPVAAPASAAAAVRAAPTAATQRAAPTAPTRRADPTAATQRADPTAPTRAAVPIYRGPAVLRRGVLAAALAAIGLLVIILLLASGGSSSRTRANTARTLQRPATQSAPRSATAVRPRAVPAAPAANAPGPPASAHHPHGHAKAPPPGHAKPDHGGKNHGHG